LTKIINWQNNEIVLSIHPLCQKNKETFHMASDALKLTAQIIISHASISELSTQELVDEIKEVYNVLASLDGGEVIPEIMAPEKGEETEVVKKPPIPLKDIVTQQHVVCLECGKKKKTLKTHIRKAHGLMPKEFFKRFALDPKKIPSRMQGVFGKTESDGKG